METALQHDDGMAVLLDFNAAFPSISREFLLQQVAHCGFPPCAMAVLHSLYLDTTGTLVLHGERQGTVPMLRGIRQGCPLSPLLFALTSDALIRMIQARIPSSIVAAFADDTAVALLTGDDRHAVVRVGPVQEETYQV